MATIPLKIQDRLVAGIKKFQPILNTAKSKDINESDTVVIIIDILHELFGYDKFSEITSEYAIKKQYCDLALKLEEKIKFIVEAKAIGLDLKDDFIKQAVDYGSNSGVDWVILTNGYLWSVYKINFSKPISHELVYEFDLLKVSGKKQEDLELLYYVSKEGQGKSVLEDYHLQKQALSKFYIGQILLNAVVLEVIKKQLKRVSPEVKVEANDIKTVLTSEMLRREVLEGEKAEEARKKINKCLNTVIKKAALKEKSEEVKEGVTNLAH